MHRGDILAGCSLCSGNENKSQIPLFIKLYNILCVKLLPLSALWLYPVSIFYIRGTYYSSWTPVVTIRVHFFVSGCSRLFMRE